MSDHLIEDYWAHGHTIDMRQTLNYFLQLHHEGMGDLRIPVSAVARLIFAVVQELKPIEEVVPTIPLPTVSFDEL